MFLYKVILKLYLSAELNHKEQFIVVPSLNVKWNAKLYKLQKLAQNIPSQENWKVDK